MDPVLQQALAHLLEALAKLVDAVREVVDDEAEKRTPPTTPAPTIRKPRRIK